jgi:hypothetical protein
MDGGSGRRKTATCTQDSTNAEETRTDIHASRFEPTIPVFELAKAVHALDRAATVIGCSLYVATTVLDFPLELKDSMEDFHLCKEWVGDLLYIAAGQVTNWRSVT